MTWQLWLARSSVQEFCLPWQSPQKHLTPGRVAQSMFSLLLHIGTPTRAVKTRGKSPGWPKGKKRRKKPPCPVVKKGFSRSKKRESG